MNLVVVSNRVAGSDVNEPRTGGLEAALVPVVQQSGAIWTGPSRPLEADPPATPLGAGKLVRVDLPDEDYRRYYEGFANSELWPALHSLTDRISCSEGDYDRYRKINALMADALLEYRDRDAFWVHDYHFLTLGAELRDRGVDRPIGFFLHTPWPAPDMQLMPHHRELTELMLAYDLLGFQTDEDRQSFLACVRADLGFIPGEDGVVISRNGGLTRCQVFPIGIDTDKFAQYAADAGSNADVSSLLDGLDRKMLAVGVDRLDYTKGLDNRIRAFDHLSSKKPRSIVLLQIATTSRSSIKSYKDYQNDVAALVDDVNARHGTDDWKPIRYETKPVSQAILAGLYRAARVGVVTPLRDGMNLVAKEYVAAQNPSDPGVLVLSKFAGAAKELNGALLVDPRNINDIADKLSAAFSMSQPERISRWQLMMERLQAYPIQRWTADFIAELEKIRTEKLAAQGPRDVGKPSGSKRKLEGKLAGGASQLDPPRQLSRPVFDAPARRLHYDFSHLVGMGWNHGPQPVPDILLGALNRMGAFPEPFLPTTDFYIHGHPYMARLAAGIREVTPNNPLGANVILIPRLKGG